MSKLNREDVLFICLGIADATESFRETLDADNWRDAIVLIDIEAAGGRVAIGADLEAAEGEVWMLVGRSLSGDTALDESFSACARSASAPGST